MPHSPYPTPSEDAVARMIEEAGSPEAAGRGLVARLLALEAAVAKLEQAAVEEQSAPEAAPAEGDTKGEA